MIIVLGNKENPAFRYEYLARFAFKCEKYGDPWGYSAQDRFTSFFYKEPNLDGQRALSTIIIKLIIDYPDNADKLKELENKVWLAKNQEDYINIIDNCIDIFEK